MNYKALILLIAGHFVTDINTGALPAFLPFIKESLSLSYTMAASIILAFNVTSSVIQPIFGYSSDRWPARWLLPAGCFIAPLGLGLLGFGSSYTWILFFASLSGLGQASYHPEGFKIVNQLSGKKKASFNSLFLFGGNLGFAVGPILATLFFSYFGLKGSLWFILPGIAMIGGPFGHSGLEGERGLFHGAGRLSRRTPLVPEATFPPGIGSVCRGIQVRSALRPIDLRPLLFHQDITCGPDDGREVSLGIPGGRNGGRPGGRPDRRSVRVQEVCSHEPGPGFHLLISLLSSRAEAGL